MFVGAKPSELLDFITPVISRSVKEHCSLLGFVGDELVGFSLHSIHDVSSTKEDVVLPEIVPSKDYSAGKLQFWFEYSNYYVNSN